MMTKIQWKRLICKYETESESRLELEKDTYRIGLRIITTDIVLKTDDDVDRTTTRGEGSLPHLRHMFVDGVSDHINQLNLWRPVFKSVTCNLTIPVIIKKYFHVTAYAPAILNGVYVLFVYLLNRRQKHGTWTYFFPTCTCEVRNLVMYLLHTRLYLTFI